MKIGLFTEFSYPDKSEQQTYAEVLEQIALADEQGYDFFSTTESYGRDLFSCSPFPLGLYVAAAQRTKRIRFLTGIVSAPAHHPAVLASEVAAADLLTRHLAVSRCCFGEIEADDAHVLVCLRGEICLWHSPGGCRPGTDPARDPRTAIFCAHPFAAFYG